jgi:MFS transporter, ACS family, D-galactonate transporter
MKQKGNVRWSIGALLGIGVLINYFDRVNMSVATKPLMGEFHLTLGQMGILISAYSWSYTLLQIPIGSIIDRIGIKWLNRVCTFFWGLATLLTAISSGMGFIILSRILLGIAEAPLFPGSSKASGYWFPLRERGVATSLFDSAAKLSNVIGLPLVAWAMSQWGWRGGFVFTAILSFAFCIAWWIWYRNPEEHPQLTEEEFQYIKEGGAQVAGEPSLGIMKSIGFALRQRKVWGLTLGFAAYGYAFTLLISWIPGYLQTEMHMSVLSSGIYSIIPWICGAAGGFFIGGLLVDTLIKKGYDPNKVRKVVVVIGMVLGLSIGGAAFTHNPNIAILFISISLGGLAISSAVGWSIPSIIAPTGSVGVVGGIMNFVNGIVGTFSTILTGYIAGRTNSFGAAFLLAVCVLAFGIICYVFLLGKIEQIKLPNSKLNKVDNVNSKPM